MKGVVFLGDRKLQTIDFPDPTPDPDEVVLEIKASGMCGSDLHFYRAADGTQSLGLGGDGSPIIAGHESACPSIRIDGHRVRRHPLDPVVELVRVVDAG